jgi:hypothetical protein
VTTFNLIERDFDDDETGLLEDGINGFRDFHRRRSKTKAS